MEHLLRMPEVVFNRGGTLAILCYRLRTGRSRRWLALEGLLCPHLRLCLTNNFGILLFLRRGHNSSGGGYDGRQRFLKRRSCCGGKRTL
jgi:hypothetical protein